MKILILGASAGIARAVAQQEIEEGGRVFLAARSPEKLRELAASAQAQGKGESVRISPFDAAKTDPDTLWREAEAFLGGIDVLLIAFGTNRRLAECLSDASLTRQELDDNFALPALWLRSLAPRFAAQGHGTIAVITSVAGDRGRKSNYVYGAAKAGLNVYLEGLRHAFWKSSVRVLTIKPGFVDTPMTAHLPKNFLFTAPERVARDIRRALRRGRSREIYTPGYWRWILWILRNCPDWIFYRTNL